MVFSSIAPFLRPVLRPGYFSALPSHAAAGLITAYQKYLSPLKGFSCAHRVLHRGESCSQYVKRTILERGLSDAWPESRQRFRDCRSAYLTIMASRSRVNAMASSNEDPEYEGAAEPKKKKNSQSSAGSTGSSPTSSECCLPDFVTMSSDGCSCLSTVVEGGGCDAWACDAGACDAGACDAGACDVGGCDVGSC